MNKDSFSLRGWAIFSSIYTGGRLCQEAEPGDELPLGKEGCGGGLGRDGCEVIKRICALY